MDMALARSGLAPDVIDYINAHAPGTINGDAAEALAIKDVFGIRANLSVSSTKGLTGHALSAAGALEAIFTCLALRNGITPGNANLREPDPVCEGLYLPTETKATAPEYALSNSAGFGGANVSLIFRRCRA
jgi:3-oxoacyl-(acyl-carrier-protein) synthase